MKVEKEPKRGTIEHPSTTLRVNSHAENAEVTRRSGWRSGMMWVVAGRKREVLRLAALAQDDYGSAALTTGPRRIVTWARVESSPSAKLRVKIHDP